MTPASGNAANKYTTGQNLDNNNLGLNEISESPFEQSVETPINQKDHSSKVVSRPISKISNFIKEMYSKVAPEEENKLASSHSRSPSPKNSPNVDI